MEHRGVPIDMEIFPQLADKETWSGVRDDMVPDIDAKYGVYVREEAGDWSFNMERFRLPRARGITGWPLLESGKLNMQRKTFEEMSRAGHSSRICGSCATRATRCARSSWRSAPTAGIARCCGRSCQDIAHTAEGFQWIFSPAAAGGTPC